jgi:hypothetical protein
MWQDSGRYEWPLTGAPESTASVSLSQAGSDTMDMRPYPDRLTAQMMSLRSQVEGLTARVQAMEQAAERHAGTL